MTTMRIASGLGLLLGLTAGQAQAQEGDAERGQQAWDVAAFINSHERPQDPRRRPLGSLDETDEIFHQHMGYYGDQIDGRRLGDHADYGENPRGAE